MFMHGGYMHIFQYVCFVFFGSALESFLEVKSFILLYFLWFRRRIDAYSYYYFNDAINTLAANGFSREVLQLLNQGK
jgi:membrane associated rhomboid family serine protease